MPYSSLDARFLCVLISRATASRTSCSGIMFGCCHHCPENSKHGVGTLGPSRLFAGRRAVSDEGDGGGVCSGLDAYRDSSGLGARTGAGRKSAVETTVLAEDRCGVEEDIGILEIVIE